jgi:hypothetical protein
MQALCEKIASIIADYRQGEIAAPDAAHVRRWIDQFPQSAREQLLTETAHILSKTYIDEATVKRFLKGVATNKKLAGDNPAAYWKGVRFLRLQQAGHSQRDMLQLFDKRLQKSCGLSVDDCGADPHTFAYLDDAVFSGGRVGGDLVRWIKTDAPKKAKVAVMVMAVHSLGEYFAGNDIKKAADAAGKAIEIVWWRAMTIEDRKAYMASSDVLRPTIIPPDAQTFVNSLGAQPVLRTGSNVGPLDVFSSAEGRHLIEQEFLKAGIEVRRLCPLLPAQMRPLGCTLMRTTGFGSTFVTYRNCANNTPLVFWAGNPWYPLFPRKTN